MKPVPAEPLRILVGGHSEPALKRAARVGDGWVSANSTYEELAVLIPKLQDYRREFGTDDRPFEIHAFDVMLADIAGVERLAALGRHGRDRGAVEPARPGDLARREARGHRALRQRGHRPLSLTNHLTRLIQGNCNAAQGQGRDRVGHRPGSRGEARGRGRARRCARRGCRRAHQREAGRRGEPDPRSRDELPRAQAADRHHRCRRSAVQAAERTVKEFGRIDGLVNSAYFHGDFGPVSEPDFATWSRILDTNLMGSVRMTLAVAPQMKKPGRRRGGDDQHHDDAEALPGRGRLRRVQVRAAVTATKYLAMELGPSNIRVNSARMGWMWGAPVQGYIAATAKAQGVPEQQLIDGVAANIPVAPHRHRRRVRARRVVPDFRLRLRGQRRRARREWR